MALFESYERREPQILACLKEYGISSIEECRDITMAAGIDVYKLIEGIQPICFENAKWAYTVGAAIAIKKNCRKASEAAAAIGQLGQRLNAVMTDGHAPGRVFIEKRLRCGKIKAIRFRMPEGDFIQRQQCPIRMIG